LAKDTPIVWLLVRPTPKTAEEEQALVKQQWQAQSPWWMGWLWFWFVWRHRSHFLRLQEQSSPIRIPIDELNRTLSGDAHCSLYTLGSERLQETLSHLAPKSFLHLFPVSTFPSKWEQTQLAHLETTLLENGHQIQWIDRLEHGEEWLSMIGQWVRYNLIVKEPSAPCRHIVLFMNRHLELWNGFDSRTNKTRFLLEQELSTYFPTCRIQILLNGPSSKDALDKIPETEPIMYGFLDTLSEDSDSLSPQLQRSNLYPMTAHPEAISWIRMLRRQIWECTGKAP